MLTHESSLYVGLLAVGLLVVGLLAVGLLVVTSGRHEALLSHVSLGSLAADVSWSGKKN